jgi:hypothetical protein
MAMSGARWSRDAVAGGVVVVATFFLVLCVVLPVPGEVRLPVTVAWLLFAPGLAIVPLLRVADGLLALVVAIAASVALETVVATTLVYGGLWSPALAFAIVLAVTVAALAIQVVSTRRLPSLGGRHGPSLGPLRRRRATPATAGPTAAPRPVPAALPSTRGIATMPALPAVRVPDWRRLRPTVPAVPRVGRPRRAALIAAALASAAIIGTALVLGGGGPDGAGPSASAAALDSASGTAGETGAPGGSAAAATGTPVPSEPPPASVEPAEIRLAVIETAAPTWVDRAGQERAQIIVVVRNDGTTPVQLDRSATTYRATAAGGLVTTGRFTQAWPELIGPGDTAFFVDTIGVVFSGGATFSSIDADVRGTATDNDPVALPVADVDWRLTDAGLEIAGSVVNDTGEDLEDVAVGALIRDRDGGLLGAVHGTSTIERVASDAAAAFATTSPGTAPIDPERVGVVDAVAFAAG